MAYTRAEFIKIVAPFAVKTMKETDISAALTIAQACLESRNGNSGLTTDANNLFGVKGVGNAGFVIMRTREQRKDGSVYYVNAQFAKYKDWQSSIDGRTKLLLGGVSWDRNKYKGVIGKRGREAARAIQAAGYATDIHYATLLISVMDAYNLYQYDQVKAPAEVKPVEQVVEGSFTINGKEAGDTFIIGGRTYVQMRQLGDFYNVNYAWDNIKKKATFNGNEINCFKLDEDRVYIQAAAIVKAYGGELKFDNGTKTTKLIKTS